MDKNILLSETFDLSGNKIDYAIQGIEKQQGTTIDELIENFEENLIVVDTEGILLEPSLEKFGNINENSKILIGLVDPKTILSLQKRGFKNGFFRSTNEKFDCALVIVDKKSAYAFGNSTFGTKLAEGSEEEIFKIINHIIWAKSDNELVQGAFKKVEEIRASVLMPTIEHGKTILDREGDSISTLTCHPNNRIIAHENNQIKGFESGYITSEKFEGYLNENNFFVRVYEDNYYKLDNSNSLFDKKFSTDINIGSLKNKSIELFSGKEVLVKETDTLEETEYVTLDEFLSKNLKNKFDLKQYLGDYKGLTAELRIDLNVKPLTVDTTYRLHPNYENKEKLVKRLNNAIDEMIKLSGDDKKALSALNNIKAESNIFERLKMYNKFVLSNEFGIKQLKNNQNSKTIKIEEHKHLVPSEIIGKLYVKNNKNYLATNEKMIKEAQTWLSKNQIEAELIADE